MNKPTTSQQGAEGGPRPARVAVAIFAILLGIYLLTTSSHFYAIDEEMMYDLTEAIGARGVLYLNDPGPSEPPVYSNYGPGQSILALPLFGMGELIADTAPHAMRDWISRAAVGWLNPLITALLAALVYLASRRIVAHRPALLAALIYGLGSIAWPHTKTFFAEPLTALLWFTSFLLIWRPGGSPPHLRGIFLAGVLAGLAPSVKIQAGLFLPILGVYVIYQCTMQGTTLRYAMRCALHLAFGTALPLLALGLYNAALFGSPLRTGYGDSAWYAFTTPFWEGFSGQIWGLRRGIIWCMPLSLLIPPGLIALWQRNRESALLCLAVTLSQLLFYATWYAWDGGGAWGPRFLNAALPFMALPLAALAATPVWRTPWMRAIAATLVVLTIPVQAGALSINMDQLFTRRSGDGPSQTLNHIQLLVDRLDRFYQRQVAPERMVLWDGFAPSEGTSNELLPRWTRPSADLRIRAPATGPTRLTIAAHSCWAAPQPTHLSLRLNGTAILADSLPCPGRVYRLLLPPGNAQVALLSPGWEPAREGVDRPGRLGVYIATLTATVGGEALRLEGDRLPAEAMPTQASAMRIWMGDIRLPLWDYWWTYLPQLPLSPGTATAIGVGWAGVALVCIGIGVACTRTPGARRSR